MKKERLYLFDTTLRDGQQTAGIDFSVADKLTIIDMLEELGIDYIEGGYPGANDVDNELFNRKRTKRAKFCAFGMVKRAGRSIANDSGLQAILKSESDVICFVAKAAASQVINAMGASLSEHIEAITTSIEAAIAAGKEVLLDGEHFFDGFKENPDYALTFVQTAIAAGAKWVIMCDTNGGNMPDQIAAIVSTVVDKLGSNARLGIHAHNDTEQAVANSLAAVNAGVRHIQGTLNGIGERCGNANLISLIPTLALKPEFADHYTIGVNDEALSKITRIARGFDDLLNRAPNEQAPYVGRSAFATKAGIHASAISKQPSYYEHIEPAKVGNQRHMLVSDQSGKSNLKAALDRFGIDCPDHKLSDLLTVIKQRESQGYAYDTGEASLAIFIRRYLGVLPEFFAIEGFSVRVERRYNALGKLTSISEAIVKLVIGDKRFMSVAEGNGPVNALDIALRKDLGMLSRYINDLRLVNFKVRILNGGTSAITRVLIESGDDKGRKWSTVGVSPNIVDASFDALVDSLIYKLIQERAIQIAPDRSLICD